MKNRFGINMKRYCRDHEASIAASTPTRALYEAHMEMLRRLQHERLIHLIVLALTCLAELFAVDLAILHPQTNPLSGAVVLMLAVLLGFYFWHYFFLENTVQRWYIIADDMLRQEVNENE